MAGEYKINSIENNKVKIIIHQSATSTINKYRIKENKFYENDVIYKEITKELNQLIGLKEIKKTILELYALLRVNKLRGDFGFSNELQVLHMIYKGNPGTGKTTVARLMGKMLHMLGFLSKGHLVEVERADLVGEYIGQTAQKTKEQIKNAIGGIMFIDEAYSLSRGGEKDFGRESIDVLVKSMEDNKHNFILVLAGYPKEMDYFLRTNPGLESRLPIKLFFSDYTINELMLIAKQMLDKKDYILSDSASNKLKKILEKEKLLFYNQFSNARLVRNYIEKAIRNHAVRVLSLPDITKEVLHVLEARDFDFNNID